ncbi:MAG TPA: YkgJ family cysteine cluster protein [Polyangiaceae bacterium]|nr:YkgJ family cysteine cluster protein [Polyangiaceae bacterium]
MAQEYDCRSCGACCHAREGTILVSSSDIVRWKRTGKTHILEQLAPGHFGQEAFAMGPRGCCVHLGMPGAPNDCSIYETRAEVCREYEAGGWQCLEARKERGIR